MRNSYTIVHERQRNSSDKELVARHLPMFFRVNSCATIASLPATPLLRLQYPSLEGFLIILLFVVKAYHPQMPSPGFSFAFAFATNILCTHTHTTQPTTAGHNDENRRKLRFSFAFELRFSFAFVIQQINNPESCDFYFFRL